MNRNQLIRSALIAIAILVGAFVHGFLSVDFLGMSYLFSLILGVTLWQCLKSNNKGKAP